MKIVIILKQLYLVHLSDAVLGSNKQQQGPSGANNYCASSSIFLEGQESKRSLHIRNKKQITLELTNQSIR